LGVFAKYWQPGNVKTRLAASIGNENAARLYRQFVRQTLARQSLTAQSRSVWIWPADKQDEFRQLQDELPSQQRWTTQVQPRGDLGRKMQAFFHQTLGHNFQGQTLSRVVLIGSDSPDLPATLIDQAFAALADHDCVLGPSHDGGYYLIGLGRMCDSIFEDIPWSSSEVLPLTLQRLKQASQAVHLLPHWNDIDDLCDLQQLESRLRNQTRLSQLNMMDHQLLASIEQYCVSAGPDDSDTSANPLASEDS